MLSNNSKNVLNVASVFSGIGAFEFALKRMDIPHKIIFACDNGGIDLVIDVDLHKKFLSKLNTIGEKNHYVRQLYKSSSRKKNFVEETYLKNYKIDKDLFFYDVRLLDGADFRGKVDILVGGSPCQSFSSVGKKVGLEDTRGTLFYDFARLVNEINPEIFIFENVRGLYTHDKGKTWNIIKEIFEKLEYKIHHTILNSKDYGIPQNRNRLFVVGFKNKKAMFSFPQPIHLEFKAQDLLLDNCKIGNYCPKNYGNISIKRDLSNIPTDYFLSPKVQEYVKKSGTKSFYQEPKTDLEIARPILATMGYNHRAGIDNYYTYGDKLRMLTEREAARLMGFTDDFIINESSSQAYKQFGNSIVVDVIIALIHSILDPLI
jgi:DNA (cytosine-5)-methyltransferase 1